MAMRAVDLDAPTDTAVASAICRLSPFIFQFPAISGVGTVIRPHFGGGYGGSPCNSHASGACGREQPSTIPAHGASPAVAALRDKSAYALFIPQVLEVLAGGGPAGPTGDQ